MLFSSLDKPFKRKEVDILIHASEWIVMSMASLLDNIELYKWANKSILFVSQEFMLKPSLGSYSRGALNTYLLDMKAS